MHNMNIWLGVHVDAVSVRIDQLRISTSNREYNRTLADTRAEGLKLAQLAQVPELVQLLSSVAIAVLVGVMDVP